MKGNESSIHNQFQQEMTKNIDSIKKELSEQINFQKDRCNSDNERKNDEKLQGLAEKGESIIKKLDGINRDNLLGMLKLANDYESEVGKEQIIV